MREGTAGTDATCPRCGHAQRGVVQSWTCDCPLEGVCSECGLAFRWSELLGSERVPTWWVEQPPGTRRRRGRWWRSTWAALRPWALWSHVRMTVAPRPAALAIWSAKTVVAWFVLASILVVLLRLSFPVALYSPGPVLGAVIEHHRIVRRGLGAVVRADAWAWTPFLLHAFGHVGMVLAMSMLWQTRRTNEVLPRHHVRIIVTSLPWTGVATLALFAILVIDDRLWNTIRLIDVWGFGGLPVPAWTDRMLWGLPEPISVPDDMKSHRGYLFGGPTLAYFVSITAMVSLWWWIALRRYLRFPHAFGTCVAGGVIGVILGVATLGIGGLLLTLV